MRRNDSTIVEVNNTRTTDNYGDTCDYDLSDKWHISPRNGDIISEKNQIFEL
jgi:hypothetical protein